MQIKDSGMKNIRILLVLFSILFAPGICPAQFKSVIEPAPYKEGVRSGVISSPRLREVSGLSVSRKNSEVLWVLNDSGNQASVFCISPKGAIINEFMVDGAENTDWEDLSGFRLGKQDYLLIADVGDNWSQRSFCTLYCVKEPDLDPDLNQTPNQNQGRLALEWEMRFRYEDGALDCEAVCVDTANRRILLLSKRKAVPVLYELPLETPSGTKMYTARAVAKVKNIPAPTPEDRRERFGRYRSQPTAMDISDDGKKLFILTYKHAYLYTRKKDQTWDAAFLTPPQQISLPDPSLIMIQREALGIDHGTGNIFITSEKAFAPIYKVEPIDPCHPIGRGFDDAGL